MARDPPCASVGARDAIFAFMLAAMLGHVLHELRHTFAIPGMYDLEQSVKRHWLQIREAEQPSPLLRYPEFVTRDLPKPQTEVCYVGREVNARFTFPQFRLSNCALLDHCRQKQQRNRKDDQKYLN